MRAQQNRQADVELQAAIRTATVSGDVRTAIKQYESLTTKYARDRAFVANVLVRMAEAYQKLGDAESRKIYERILNQYSDQKDAAAIAQSRLRIDAGISGSRMSFREVLKLGESQAIDGTVSRNGRYLAYVDFEKNGNLFLRDLQSGASRALTDGATVRLPQPNVQQFAAEHSFSRDSRQIAYNWFRESDKPSVELRLIDLKGDGLPHSRLLFDNPEVDWIAPSDWSPDGKSIAVQMTRRDRTRQIGLISVSDGSLRILKSIDWTGSRMNDGRLASPTMLLFSPDGKYLAYDLPNSDAGDQPDVFVLAVDGSREIPAVVSPSQDGLVAWSNDGKRLLFTSDRTGSIGLWSVGFANGRIEGQPELIRREIGRFSSLDMTDDGKLYLAMGSRVRGGDIRITSVDFGAGSQTSSLSLAVQTYTGSNQFPSWSPDGKRLAYVSSRRPFVFGIRDAETRSVRELTPSPAFDLVESLTWDIEGSLVAKALDRKGAYGLFRIDPQTGQTSPLATDDGDPETRLGPGLGISLNGKKLVYSRQPRSIANTVPPQPSRIWYEKDIASGAEKEIARTFFGSVSPNGQYLGPMGGPERPKTPRILDLNTGAIRELPGDIGGDDLFSLRWAPDSSAIYVLRSSGELWRLPIDGSQPRKVNLKVDGIPVTANFSVHPDGQRIAFETQPAKQAIEIWVLENFLPQQAGR